MIANADKWERRLLRLAITSVVILVVIQAALFRPEIRLYLSRVDRLEGETVHTELTRYTTNPPPITEQTVVGTGMRDVPLKQTAE